LRHLGSTLRPGLKLFKIARPSADGVIPSSEGPAFSVALCLFPSAPLRSGTFSYFSIPKKCIIMHFFPKSARNMHYSALFSALAQPYPSTRHYTPAEYFIPKYILEFGGGVCESNAPFVPRRNGSPALKAGKITGLFSPPRNYRTLWI
jgi:hypothetical protein